MATKNEKYWEKRRDLEDKARLKMEDKAIQSIVDNLPGTLEKIQAQLLSQADLHDMTLPELLEDFSLRDQKKYKKYIDENYKELMKSDEKYQEFIDEYFPKYDYAKVNRLLQIRTDIFRTLADDVVKNKSTEKFELGLEDIVTRIYNSNSNVFMTLLGPGDYNSLSKQDLENMLNYPWSGKTFSNRLWGNISRLEQNLSKAIVDSVQSGNGVLEAIKTMKNDSSISDMFKLEEGKFNRAITNLVRTEYSHFAVEGLRKSVKDAGIEQLQSWSAEDERVCDICGTGKSGRHGKIITDGWYPPYHNRCRCTAIPKMPELDESIDQEFEEMFGDLLDEFANDKFGVKLNHPPKKNKESKLLKLGPEDIGDIDRIKEAIQRTKEVVDTYKKDSGVDIIELFNNKSFSDKNNPYEDEKSKFVKYLLKNKGFDGLPKTITDTTDLIQIYRGVVDYERGNDSAQNQVDRFEGGSFDISGAKSSTVGRGSYFTNAKQKAQEYVDKGNNGKLINAYLADTIKLLDDSMFLREKKAFNNLKESLGEDSKYYEFLLSKNYLMDTQKDIFALICGYDGIQRGSTYNILNRTALGVAK